MEGAATTVYAQGGRGNSRLVAWEGERTVTFTMEDALISPEGFMILSGAGLVEADSTKKSYVYQHMMETTDDVVVADAELAAAINEWFGSTDGDEAAEGDVVVFLKQYPHVPAKGGNFAYVMITEDGAPITEPIIPYHHGIEEAPANDMPEAFNGKYPLILKEKHNRDYLADADQPYEHDYHPAEDKLTLMFEEGVTVVLVDYYTRKASGAKQINITPDKFGGNYYLEASTLFRNEDGVDMPAEFIIPNCKVQSNFNFTMASSGDPSTFTFTLDAFPDYTRFDNTQKVLAAIQIIEDASGLGEIVRDQTIHNPKHDFYFND